MVIQASDRPGEHPERTTAAAFPRYTNGDQIEAMTLATRIAVMKGWPGAAIR